MPRNSYKVLVDDQVYARDMELSTAMVLVEGLFDKWYQEPNLAITIQRESDSPTACAVEDKIEVTR